MFQITEFTEAHLSGVANRIEKHGDEEVPAVSLSIEIVTGNTILDTIDPTLRQALYKAKSDDTPELPGIEASTPILRSGSIDRVILPTSHEGWTLLVDDGVDDTQPMTFGDCKVDKFSVEPKQGGTISLKLRIGTSDVNARRLGRLGMLNGQAIWVQIEAPIKTDATAIDGTVAALKADHPDATDLFAGGGPEDDADDEGATPDIEDDEDAGPDLEDGLDNALALADSQVDTSIALSGNSGAESCASAEQPPEPERSENWPFGANGEPAAGPGEAAAFEAGAAQAIAAAGVALAGRRSRRAPVVSVE